MLFLNKSDINFMNIIAHILSLFYKRMKDVLKFIQCDNVEAEDAEKMGQKLAGYDITERRLKDK